jgi:hypothetical protein
MGRLETVRHELLALHRALLDAQRVVHERAHGKVTSGAFLELVIGAPEFAWLRPLTALIVSIDEALEEANPDSPRARRLALLAAKKAALAGPAGAIAVASPAPQDTGASTPGEALGDTAANVEALLLADTQKLLTPDADLSSLARGGTARFDRARAEQPPASAALAGEFQRRYATALHDAPEIALAHASVLRALASPAASRR